MCPGGQTMSLLDLGNHSLLILDLLCHPRHQNLRGSPIVQTPKKLWNHDFAKFLSLNQPWRPYFLRLGDCPESLCGAETKMLQMRPSQCRTEVVTDWWIFQNPPRNQENPLLSCRKTALAAKPCVHMTGETTPMIPLVSSFDLPPLASKSEPVTKR